MGTIILVVPAKAGTHSPRIPLLKQSRRPVFSNNIRRGVWVPAFAGTTKIILATRFRPSCASTLPPSKIEGAGNAGCALHPRSRVPKCVKKAHTSIQVSGGSPTSPAQWLYGLLRALPGERAFLPPSPLRRLLLKSLTPASRRQDHTTSPYALAFSSGAKNAPDAKASTASRAPRVVTIMIRPSCGRETGAVIILISRNVKRNIFDSGA